MSAVSGNHGNNTLGQGCPIAWLGNPKLFLGPCMYDVLTDMADQVNLSIYCMWIPIQGSLLLARYQSKLNFSSYLTFLQRSLESAFDRPQKVLYKNQVALHVQYNV